MTRSTFSDAVNELSPGMEIIGYDPTEPVVVVRFRGGPFDHVRSIPANRDSPEFLTNGLFVVVRASDVGVLGTSGLRYERGDERDSGRTELPHRHEPLHPVDVAVRVDGDADRAIAELPQVAAEIERAEHRRV